MDRLPPEIILEIVSHLQVEGDHQCAQACPYISQLKNLVATSRTLAHIVTPFLYAHDAAHAGRALLHGAYHDSIKTISYSLSLGANPNRKAPLRLPRYKRTAVGTALHVAVNEGHLAVAQYLLEHGAHPNSVSMDVCACQHNDHPYWPSPPWSSLHLALCKNHLDIAEHLLSAGAHFVLSRDYPGTEVDEVSFMRGNMLVRRASRGVHLLEEVTRRGSLRMFRYLLAHHADKLVFDEYRPNALTPLHHIARVTDDEAQLEMARELLDRGAKLRPAPDLRGPRKTPGGLPFDRGFIDWVAAFEAAPRGAPPAGAHPYAQLLTFLRYISADNRPFLAPLRERVLELWMDRGPAAIDCGWSLLYQSFGIFDAGAPEPGLVRAWVLSSMRDPKLEATGPMTLADVLRFIPSLGFGAAALQPLDELLLEAAGLGLAEECGLFVEHGAWVGARDSEGRTALHLAARAGDLEAVRVLVARGADVGARDGGGETAEGVAGRFGHPEVVALLREWRVERVGVRAERAGRRCCLGRG